MTLTEMMSKEFDEGVYNCRKQCETDIASRSVTSEVVS